VLGIIVPLFTWSFELSFWKLTLTAPGFWLNANVLVPEPWTDLVPELSAIAPSHGPLLITFICGVPVDDADCWVDCPSLVWLFVLLPLLVQPLTKTTKIKIPIIAKIPKLNFLT